MGEVPGLTGLARKVTGVPAQTDEVAVAMLTLTGCTEVTVMVTALLVAGDPVRQGDAFEIITTVTTSLLFRFELTKEALLDPASIPLTFH